MAFQFKCSECRADIEVDDEYKGQRVTCPYCQKPTNAVETNEAIATDAAPMGDAPPIPMVQNGDGRKTILGWLALAFIIIGIAMSIYMRSQLPGVMAGLDRQTMSQEEFNKEMANRMQARPDIMICGFLGGCVLPVASIVLAIICLARKIPPRWPAVAALCILAGLLAFSFITASLAGNPAAATCGP